MSLVQGAIDQIDLAEDLRNAQLAKAGLVLERKVKEGLVLGKKIGDVEARESRKPTNKKKKQEIVYRLWKWKEGSEGLMLDLNEIHGLSNIIPSKSIKVSVRAFNQNIL